MHCVCEVDQGCGAQREQTAINLAERTDTVSNHTQGSESRERKLPSRLSRPSSSLVFDLICSQERRCVCVSERKRREESMCVRVHGGEIHYSDNESIWDNMRQFTSPVVVSGAERVEDTPPARSHRMWSSAAASLARLATCATVPWCMGYLALRVWHRRCRHCPYGQNQSSAFFMENREKVI